MTLALVAGLLLLALRRRGGRRQQAVRDVLDAADDGFDFLAGLA